MRRRSGVQAAPLHSSAVSAPTGRPRATSKRTSPNKRSSDGAAAGARKVGRPPRIDRSDIARAVLEIGFDDLSMKRAAAHLGVSVPGLYHYVRGKDDLIRLAVEHSLGQVRLPEDHGQHWATWLREWARYVRAAMSGRPELVEHYLSGVLDPERLVQVVGHTLDVLRSRGFPPQAALEAWEAVGTLALGTAVEDIRERQAAADGQPWIARVHGTLARMEPGDLPTMRELVAEGFVPDSHAAFERRITTALVGLAVLNDLPIDDEVLGRATESPDAAGAAGAAGAA